MPTWKKVLLLSRPKIDSLLQKSKLKQEQLEFHKRPKLTNWNNMLLPTIQLPLWEKMLIQDLLLPRANVKLWLRRLKLNLRILLIWRQWEDIPKSWDSLVHYRTLHSMERWLSPAKTDKRCLISSTQHSNLFPQDEEILPVGRTTKRWAIKKLKNK